VAALVSPGFGAGWSSWNTERPEMLFDPGIVELVEQQKWQELETYARLKYPDAYLGGMQDLQVWWLHEGTEFIITEYDGNETLEIKTR